MPIYSPFEASLSHNWLSVSPKLLYLAKRPGNTRNTRQKDSFRGKGNHVIQNKLYSGVILV